MKLRVAFAIDNLITGGAQRQAVELAIRLDAEPDVAARHFAQAADLYGPVEMRDPATAEVTAQFESAAREVAEILANHDQQRFDAMFQEVRAFFGDFAREATEESRFLIDRLVERSMA